MLAPSWFRRHRAHHIRTPPHYPIAFISVLSTLRWRANISFKTPYGGRFALSVSLIKPKIPSYTSPMTQHQSFFCNLAPLLYRFHCFPRYFVFLFSIVLCELCLLHQLGPNMFLPPVDYCNGSGLKTIISFCNWIDSRTFHDNFQFIVLNNCTFLVGAFFWENLDQGRWSRVT